MARRCALTGKRPLAGNLVSHSNRKARTRQMPNLQSKRIFVPELGRTLRVKLCTRALRTVDKKGLMAFLRDEGLSIRDIT